MTRDPDGPLARLALASITVPPIALPPAPPRPGGSRWPASAAARRSAAPPPLSARAGRREGGVRMTSARGQASILLLGGLAGMLVAALILGAVARAVGQEAAAQRAADLAALAGARGDARNYARLFEPAASAGRRTRGTWTRRAYLALGRTAAARVRAANGAPRRRGRLPRRGSFAPVRIRVDGPRADPRHAAAARTDAAVGARAEAQLGAGADATSLPAAATTARSPSGRASRCARTSPWRSTAWSAAERRRHHPHDRQRVPVRRRAGGACGRASRPEVGRPAGPLAAPLRHRARPRPEVRLPLAGRATPPRFHFVQRYSWEPWHWATR